MQNINHNNPKYFTPFKADISGVELPKRFTFPFYYQPHNLSLQAAAELQEVLDNQLDLKRELGVGSAREFEKSGKMFGVLIVETHTGEIGFLSAFSGKLETELDIFVPFVYNLPKGENFYSRGMSEIAELGKKIEQAQNLPEMAVAKKELEVIFVSSELEIKAFRERMQKAKSVRKTKRLEAKKSLEQTDYFVLEEALANESRHNRYLLKALSQKWEEKIFQAKEHYSYFQNKLESLIEERAAFSANLQEQLFANYRFLNSKGERKSLLDIFNGSDKPPSGAGDCAAPKLLQYAFANELRPVAMAEFWWGASPKTTIRHHKKFYPACNSKCKPILAHVLKGMELDSNPMLIEHGQDRAIETVYEDEYLLVINKPPGLLSVPGKEIHESVISRMQEKYRGEQIPILVHRLDMDTSGLLLLAKTSKIHKRLQQQFLKRKVTKRYVALLAGTCQKPEGTIDLPLRVDISDRPNQMVCFEHGKRAITRYEVVEVKNGMTRIHFYPQTGRTHQLRMHAAHPLGLNCPIVGDILYGKDDKRMYLHAEILEFEHPKTKEKLRVEAKPQF